MLRCFYLCSRFPVFADLPTRSQRQAYAANHPRKRHSVVISVICRIRSILPMRSRLLIVVTSFIAFRIAAPLRARTGALSTISATCVTFAVNCSHMLLLPRRNLIAYTPNVNSMRWGAGWSVFFAHADMAAFNWSALRLHLRLFRMLIWPRGTLRSSCPPPHLGASTNFGSG